MNIHAVALSTQLRSLATRWRKKSLLSRDPINVEISLATSSWDVISCCIEYGYLGKALDPLMESIELAENQRQEIRKQKKRGISFRSPGWAFYLLAGYSSVYKRELEQPDGSIVTFRVLRPGVISYITDDAFPDISEVDFTWLDSFDRNEASILVEVYEQYAVVCEMIANLVSDNDNQKTKTKKTSTKKPSRNPPSECEQFIFNAWSKMKEKKQVDMQAILDVVMERYPSEEQRKRKTGTEIGQRIIEVDDVNRVVNCLKARQDREKNKKRPKQS